MKIYFEIEIQINDIYFGFVFQQLRVEYACGGVFKIYVYDILKEQI